MCSKLAPSPAAGAALDGAVDVVLGHAVAARLLDGVQERRIGGRVAAALFGGHRDGARELGEQLAAPSVLLALLVLDGRPLGVTRHCLPHPRMAP